MQKRIQDNFFWKTFKPFLPTKGAKSANDIVLQENDETIKERYVVATLFNDYFVNICHSMDAGFNSDDFESHPSILSIRDLMNIKRDPQEKFSFDEVPVSVVADIVKSLKTSKSPGFDKINSLFVKLLSKAIIEPLTELINLCIRKGVVPLAWKSAQVTPIFKSDEPLDKRNYRPISAVPVFDSVFEKCLYRQLYKWSDDLLVSRQSVFRKHHGCDTALIDLIETGNLISILKDQWALYLLILAKPSTVYHQTSF